MKNAFTLIELMIVVAIMGIIAGISIPSLLRSRMSANEASASGGLRTIAAAQTDYNNNSAAAFAGNNGEQYSDAGESDRFINDIYPLQPDTPSNSTNSSTISANTSFTDCQSKYCQTTGNCSACESDQTNDNSTENSSTSNNSSSTPSTTSPTTNSPAGINAGSSSSSNCTQGVDCSTPITLTVTPTFTSHYETYTGNADNGYINDINIKITPTELGGKSFNGVKVDLGGQGLPTPYSSNTNINLSGWGTTTDWNCSLGTAVTCQGSTIFNLNTKSIFAFFFTGSLASAPNNLTVQLLENGTIAATLSVPLQNP